MSYKANLEQPLRLSIVNGLLVISVGLDRLEGNDCHPSIPCLKITDHEMWGKDLAREMQRDDDQGASMLSDFLDSAIQEAIDMGSAAIDQRAYERALKKRNA